MNKKTIIASVLSVFLLTGCLEKEEVLTDYQNNFTQEELKSKSLNNIICTSSHKNIYNFDLIKIKEQNNASKYDYYINIKNVINKDNMILSLKKTKKIYNGFEFSGFQNENNGWEIKGSISETNKDITFILTDVVKPLNSNTFFNIFQNCRK